MSKRQRSTEVFTNWSLCGVSQDVATEPHSLNFNNSFCEDFPFRSSQDTYLLFLLTMNPKTFMDKTFYWVLKTSTIKNLKVQYPSLLSILILHWWDGKKGQHDFSPLLDTMSEIIQHPHAKPSSNLLQRGKVW